MMFLAALALAASAQDASGTFTAGAWTGQCARVQKGDCTEYVAVLDGPVTLRFRRTATQVAIITEAEDCKAPSRPAFVNPTYSSTTLTYMIRGHIVLALNACKSKLGVPDLKPADTAELLRLTEIKATS